MDKTKHGDVYASMNEAKLDLKELGFYVELGFGDRENPLLQQRAWTIHASRVFDGTDYGIQLPFPNNEAVDSRDIVALVVCAFDNRIDADRNTVGVPA